MMTPQIALIGTEGSGKTVLTTVLAKKLATMQDGGIWLDPQNVKTGKYIAKNWTTLCGGEWVSSTAAGMSFELEWKMQTKNGECPVRIIDSAGQDLRRLFSDEGYNDPNITDQDRQFIKYIADSTILLVLVNLRDFLGEPDKGRVIDNTFILKGVLQELQKDGKKRQIAFVFPSCDLYEATIEKEYGSAEQFFKKELPYLYNVRVAGKPVKCFAVAAVADTEVQTNDDGIARRVPAPNFSSNGIDPLIQWLAKTVIDDVERWKWQERWAKIKKGIYWVIAILAVLFVLNIILNTIGSGVEANRLSIEAERLKMPRPEQCQEDWKWDYTCNGGLWDCWSHHATAYVPIRNDGGAGNITVTFTLGERTGRKTEYFNQNEAKWVRVDINKLPHHNYKSGNIDYKAAGE